MPKQHPRLQHSHGHFPRAQKRFCGRGVGPSCQVGADFIRWRGVLKASCFPPPPSTHPAWSRDWDIPPNPLPLLQTLPMTPPGCWGLSDAASAPRSLSLALEGCRSIPWAEQAGAEGPPLPRPHRNSWKSPKIDLLVENSPSPLTSFLQAGPPACDPPSPAQTSPSQPCLGKMKRVQREGKQPAGGVWQEPALGILVGAGCCRRRCWRVVFGLGVVLEGFLGGMQLLQQQLLLLWGPCLCSETGVGFFGKGHGKRSCCPWDVFAAQAYLGVSLGFLTL